MKNSRTKKRRNEDRVRTIYDEGAEEYGRKQLDLNALGGAPALLNDEDFDWDDQPHKIQQVQTLSKQMKLMREKRNDY